MTETELRSRIDALQPLAQSIEATKANLAEVEAGVNRLTAEAAPLAARAVELRRNLANAEAARSELVECKQKLAALREAEAAVAAS